MVEIIILKIQEVGMEFNYTKFPCYISYQWNQYNANCNYDSLKQLKIAM